MRRERTVAMAEGACAALAALAAARWGGRWFWPPDPVVAALAALAVAAVVGRWPAATACARMAVGLLAVEVASGEGWWALGAVSTGVAWRDARAGASGARPLVPVAVGAVAALGWSAVRPGENAWRAVGVACVAAVAVAVGARWAAGAAGAAGAAHPSPDPSPTSGEGRLRGDG